MRGFTPPGHARHKGAVHAVVCAQCLAVTESTHGRSPFRSKTKSRVKTTRTISRGRAAAASLLEIGSDRGRHNGDIGSCGRPAAAGKCAGNDQFFFVGTPDTHWNNAGDSLLPFSPVKQRTGSVGSCLVAVRKSNAPRSRYASATFHEEHTKDPLCSASQDGKLRHRQGAGILKNMRMRDKQ